MDGKPSGTKGVRAGGGGLDSLAHAAGPAERSAPARALLFATFCLVLPLVAVATLPGWADGPGALLVWLPALLPAFLLSYYRGWNGASLSLAGGMATLALSQVEVLLLDLPAPSWEVVFGVVLLLVVVGVGSGWLSDVLGKEREAARRMALTDQLTGIPNRRHGMVVLESMWAAACRGDELAIVMFDVDFFKRINDTYGHAVGDEVLQAVARELAGRTRAMDLSARIGGEEFLSILGRCGADAAVTFAEEIRSRIAEADLPCGTVTMSAGVAVYEKSMGAPDVLLAAADRALYAAKEAGRDRVMRADELIPEERVAGDGAAAGRSAAAVSGNGLEGLSVLVVDDDRGSLRGTRRTLEVLGCDVAAFDNPFEAIRRAGLGEVAPKLIVSDVVMPEMSGFVLVDRLANRLGELPVLYMSGYDQREMFWDGAPGSPHALLKKPFAPDEMKGKLLELLELRAPR